MESASFLALYSHPTTTATGRARLLDGSSARGPHSFWRRVPVETPREVSSVPFFSFPEPAAFPIALAVDLLLRPPIAPDGRARRRLRRAHLPALLR